MKLTWLSVSCIMVIQRHDALAPAGPDHYEYDWSLTCRQNGSVLALDYGIQLDGRSSFSLDNLGRILIDCSAVKLHLNFQSNLFYFRD